MKVSEDAPALMTTFRALSSGVHDGGSAERGDAPKRGCDDGGPAAVPRDVESG